MLGIVKEKVKPIEGPNAPWLLIIVLLILLGGAVSVFGDRPIDTGDQAGQIPPAASETRDPRIYTVSYRAGVFSPTNLRIHVGDTVRFKNESFHSIHIISDSSRPDRKDLPGFDSIGDIPQNSYFTFTFSSVGIFGYHNDKDPEEGGTIIV